MRRLRTKTARASMHQKLLEACDIRDPYSEPTSSHHEVTKTEIKRGETYVQKVLFAIDGFMNPFNPPPEHNPYLLYRISPGKPIPKEIEEDVFRANPAGVKLKKTFIEERFKPETKSKKFYDPIKKLNLKCMGDVVAQSIIAKDKSITYAEQSDKGHIIRKANQPG